MCQSTNTWMMYTVLTQWLQWHLLDYRYLPNVHYCDTVTTMTCVRLPIPAQCTLLWHRDFNDMCQTTNSDYNYMCQTTDTCMTYTVVTQWLQWHASDYRHLHDVHVCDTVTTMTLWDYRYLPDVHCCDTVTTMTCVRLPIPARCTLLWHSDYNDMCQTTDTCPMYTAVTQWLQWHVSDYRHLPNVHSCDTVTSMTCIRVPTPARSMYTVVTQWLQWHVSDYRHLPNVHCCDTVTTMTCVWLLTPAWRTLFWHNDYMSTLLDHSLVCRPFQGNVPLFGWVTSQNPRWKDSNPWPDTRTNMACHRAIEGWLKLVSISNYLF